MVELGQTPTKDLRGALAVYKVKYGYTTNKSIDLDLLEEILKENKDNGSKTTTRKPTRARRPSNK